jgi:hypothetical protein
MPMSMFVFVSEYKRPLEAVDEHRPARSPEAESILARERVT